MSHARNKCNLLFFQYNAISLNLVSCVYYVASDKQYIGEYCEILESSDKVFIGNDFPDEFAHSKATDKAEFPDHNKFEIMSDGMVYLFVFSAQG